METARTLRELSCADDYDPDSMPVERARALIRQFLAPVSRDIGRNERGSVA